MNVLMKIPIRRAIREKEKSLCVMAAVFFQLCFLSWFFQACFLFWMRYYPTVGRMPEKGKEIVVSDQYLKDRGMTYKPGMSIELTYFLEDGGYTNTTFTGNGQNAHVKTFTVVGTYSMAMQPLHVVLTSEDFYRETWEELEQRGIKPEDGITRMAGIMFASRGNPRRLASMLTAEEDLSLEEGEFALNETSLLFNVGAGVWGTVICLLAFVMLIGYLFISNIFQISIIEDTRFYGKLAIGGVTKSEIKKIIRWENNILFLLSAIPAFLFGYVFSAAMLPGVLSGYITLQIKRSGNVMIFILSFLFSFLTVKISERKLVKLAKNISSIEMKKYMGKYGGIRRSDNGNCLKKFAVRHVKSDKKKVLQVCVSLILAIFLANAFYAMVAGFDEKEYVKENLDADFIVGKNPVFANPNVNAVSYPRTEEEEIAGLKSLPGIKESGGGTVSLVCLLPPKEVWKRVTQLVGEDCYETPGKMYTMAYGLDDIMLKQLKSLEGEIDLELLHTGKYVLLNPIMSDNNLQNTACYKPGDKIIIPFRSGEKGTYTVMAVVEELPFSLGFPGSYPAGSLYLPMEEWQEKERRKDYYLYAFNVEEAYHPAWNEALEEKAGKNLLSFKSAKTSAESAKEYTIGLKVVGVVLSGILLSMGILNFINCTVGGIYSRRKEFAVFQSMGMEEREICQILIKEGILYMAGGFVPGVFLSVPGVYLLLEKVLRESYITYHIYPAVYVMFAFLGSLAAIVVPYISYKKMNKKESFLERVRYHRE